MPRTNSNPFGGAGCSASHEAVVTVKSNESSPSAPSVRLSLERRPRTTRDHPARTLPADQRRRCAGDEARLSRLKHRTWPGDIPNAGPRGSWRSAVRARRASGRASPAPPSPCPERNGSKRPVRPASSRARFRATQTVPQSQGCRRSMSSARVEDEVARRDDTLRAYLARIVRVSHATESLPAAFPDAEASDRPLMPGAISRFNGRPREGYGDHPVAADHTTTTLVFARRLQRARVTSKNGVSTGLNAAPCSPPGSAPAMLPGSSNAACSSHVGPKLADGWRSCRQRPSRPNGSLARRLHAL